MKISIRELLLVITCLALLIPILWTVRARRPFPRAEFDRAVKEIPNRSFSDTTFEWAGGDSIDENEFAMRSVAFSLGANPTKLQPSFDEFIAETIETFERNGFEIEQTKPVIHQLESQSSYSIRYPGLTGVVTIGLAQANDKNFVTLQAIACHERTSPEHSDE